jgi:hypothetical protein
MVTGFAVVALEMIGMVTVSVDTPAGNVTDSLKGSKIPLAGAAEETQPLLDRAPPGRRHRQHHHNRENRAFPQE